MSPAPAHQGPIVFDKNGVQGWTWNWTDEIAQTTQYGYGQTFNAALAGRGYVTVNGKFYKKGQEPHQ